jgi:outer membrane protein OmpA-like peptidoglycan-associated protein
MHSEAVAGRHLLIRRDPPPWPFLWRGLLPLLVLALAVMLASGPVARQGIEATVRQETRAQLDAAGYRWVKLDVSGQSVTLSGEAPTTDVASRALALARTATCPTWLGRRTCAVSVTGNFSLAPPAPAAPTSAVSPLAAPGPGMTPAAAPLTASMPVTPAAARRCERSLASLLRREQIDFRFGSATIARGSAPLLDRLAKQVSDCPGNIRIEGFTDNVGKSAVNQATSAARAAAVRAALIAPGVPAQGLGPAHPIASNRTAKGRARNRRIEFHVDPNPT